MSHDGVRSNAQGEVKEEEEESEDAKLRKMSPVEVSVEGGFFFFFFLVFFFFFF